jgi:hypothetical protein
MLISDQLCLLPGLFDPEVEGLEGERGGKGGLLGEDDSKPGSEFSFSGVFTRSSAGMAGGEEYAMALFASADRGPLAFRLNAGRTPPLPPGKGGEPTALTSISPETVREPWCSAY